MNDSTSAIARAQQPRSIAAYIQQLQPEIARALPKGMDADRVARLALTVVRQSEMAKAKGTAKTSLADCTPESFAGALLTAVALGLEPGVDGEAYLIPYGKECTFVPGYKGISKLFFQHPLARHLDAQVVYENDHFDYELGLTPRLSHRPALGDRGKPVYIYAVATLSTGASRFEVMTPEQVAAVRAASPKRSGDIRDPQMWMSRKTVLKQLLKLMPKSTQLTQALAADERPGSELQADRVSVVQGGAEIDTAPAIEPVPDGVDPYTGEIAYEPDPDPEPEAVPTSPPPQKKTSPVNDARGKGSPSAPPSGGEDPAGSGTEPAQGESAGAADRSGTDRPGGGKGGEADATAGQADKLTVKQRAALMARWSELGLAKNADREERLLTTTSLLGLEPGSIESSNDLTVEQAGSLLSVLAGIADREDLDRRLSGQEPMGGDH